MQCSQVIEKTDKQKGDLISRATKVGTINKHAKCYTSTVPTKETEDIQISP